MVSAHIHDNHGEKDEHLAPGAGTIDWTAALPELANVPMVLELKEQPGWTEPAPASVTLEVAREAFDFLERGAE